jgi:hypothetical protein
VLLGTALGAPMVLAGIHHGAQYGGLDHGDPGRPAGVLQNAA